MPRRNLQIQDFTKGTTLKSEMLGGYGFPRIQNFKIVRAGVIQRRGGWDDWDTTSQDYGVILGLKRWYREDRNRSFFFAATISGGTTLKLWEYTISNKTVASLVDITENVELDAPVLWVDCESILVAMPLQYHGAPWSLRIKDQGVSSIHASQMGLTPPPNAPQLTPGFIDNPNAPTVIALEDGLYQYRVTRYYGTKSKPKKFGESAPGPVSLVVIKQAGTTGEGAGIVTLDTLETFSGANIVHGFGIYRTKKNSNIFYRVGEIFDINTQIFVDTLSDSLIDTSRILPLLTGSPPTLLCGAWHDNRLWGFANSGELFFSAAGQPDIFPYTASVIGKKGYVGHGIVVLQGNKYALKEDGIFIITGSVPNIGYRKVDDTGCFSRGSVSLVGDDIYFLGIGPQGAGVYRFDGNRAELVDHQISEITRRKDSYFFKKAYGRKVGNEYWLSIQCEDPRYTPHTEFFNNVILVYNTLYKFWDVFYGQATSIECFDGPGDAQEVFMAEADPAANTTGTFFRYNPYSGIGPQTTYPSGSRSYSKVANLASRITVGTLKEPRYPLDATQPHMLSAFFREVDGLITLNYYSNLNLENAQTYNPELDYRTYNLNGKYKFGIAKFDTNSQFFNISVLDKYAYTLKDIQFPHGIFLEVVLNSTNNLVTTIEGLEYLYDWTNEEGKN